ncbi:uncharacterized protein LOC143267426 [Peromyscus maniculatus bairdii]|uniref:uncharacterized protein LOC143267426 n=1 Tax=Peromyscus maniculatus bairdii TaxID=230844 RepID=UPI003FCFBCE6
MCTPMASSAASQLPLRLSFRLSPPLSGPRSAPEWTSGKMRSHSGSEKARQCQPVLADEMLSILFQDTQETMYKDVLYSTCRSLDHLSTILCARNVFAGVSTYSMPTARLPRSKQFSSTMYSHYDVLPGHGPKATGLKL